MSENPLQASFSGVDQTLSSLIRFLQLSQEEMKILGKTWDSSSLTVSLFTPKPEPLSCSSITAAKMQLVEREVGLALEQLRMLKSRLSATETLESLRSRR